jgi:hypothetical protein
MRFFSVLFAGGVIASLSLSSFAQTADFGAPAPQPQASPAQQQQTAPQPQTAPPAAQAPVAPLKLENLPPDPHTPTQEERAAEAAAQIRMQVSRLAQSQANWGPKASSPGMALTMKEVGRAKTPSGTQITYRLTGTGFPPGTRLTLVRWALNRNDLTPLMNGIVIDTSGNAVCGESSPAPSTKTDAPATPPAKAAAVECSKTMAANAPVEITTTAAKGEAVRVALVADDKKGGAATSAVPFPLESEDRGCKLQVLLGSKDAELVLIEGDGVKASDNFTLGAETFGQKTTLGAKPDAQGHLVAAMTPYVQGHDSGDTVIFYQSDACTPTLSFHWGKGSYKVE